MHESIRNELESLLEGHPGLAAGHLAGCRECASQVAAMREQNDWLRTLKTKEECEPGPGFYARVMQRIEERAQNSIWAVFIYSPFGRRFTLASLTVALMLGSYVVAEEKIDGYLAGDAQVHYDVPVEGDQAQQRDAVLQNFAIHNVSLQK